MARVKITIELDNGDITEIEQELAEGSLETFDQIEDFTLSARRALFPKLQEQLLSKSQIAFKKKKD
jgi:cell division protein FtsX